MNNFSSFGSMMGRGSVNVNSMNYISKYAKNITLDFSGISFTDLSATPSYALTAGGLNRVLNMTDGNTTFSRLKYNNALLKTTDFAPSSSSSFTIYVKHAARYSSLCPFNFQNPNVLKLSTSVVSSGSTFTASFYSTLNPGTTVPYSITGCSSADLCGAAISGVLTAPYQSTTYSVAAGVAGRSIKFDVSGGTVVPLLYVPDVVYTVTVVGAKFYFNGSATLEALTPGNIYKFDQSESSNTGKTLVFGTVVDALPYYNGMTINGIAGTSGASTILNYINGLVYFCAEIEGMFYVAPSYETSGTIRSTEVNGNTVKITFSTSGYIKINSSNTSVDIILVGKGGAGGASSGTYGGGGGGGGGVTYIQNYSIVSGAVYNFVVDSDAINYVGATSFSDLNVYSYPGRGGGNGGGSVGTGGLGGYGTSSNFSVGYYGGRGSDAVAVLGTSNPGAAPTTIDGVEYSGGGQGHNSSTTNFGRLGVGRAGNKNASNTFRQGGGVVITFTLS